MESLLVIALILAVLAILILIPLKFSKIAEEKGHYGYFWWVFFLGIAGMLMVVALPDRSNRVNKETSHNPQPASNPESGYSLHEMSRSSNSHYAKSGPGDWVCNKCGKVNPKYTGTCSCGNSKYSN